MTDTLQAGSIKNIYSHLQDDISRQLFENRLLYALTGDEAYINRLIASLPQKAKLDQAAAFCREHREKIVFYGAGNDLLLLSRLYQDLPVQRFCDGSRKKQREGWRGIPVMSPEELLGMKEDVYVAVATSGFYREIVRFLREGGFGQGQILNLGLATDVERQYFDPDVLAPQAEGVFIDGGCFDGGTDRAFIKWCAGRYQKILAFEPDQRNYQKCLEACRREQWERVEIQNRGLWDCETELFFRETGGQGSRIGEGEGTIHIRTAAIDEAAGDEDVTYIKLDVEGAELKALQGAARTIRKKRPRLAVSIYHKPEDIVELPEYILSLRDDYRFYIRHYQMSDCETILYAL